MTTCTVTLRTALAIAKHRKKVVPRWKRYRLRNPEKDREQRAAYYRRNRDKIAANSRIRYLKEKEAKRASINAQRRAISKGVT
ncbi:MAG: hypothetical protein WCJ93_11450 [Methanomicrobiales archaeon]